MYSLGFSPDPSSWPFETVFTVWVVDWPFDAWPVAEDSVFGRYDFEVDMTDTTRLYDLTLYTRLDGTDLPDSLPVAISFISPGGAVTESELVFCGEGAQLVDSSYFSRGLKVPYLQDFLPDESGIWKLSVYARPAAYLRGFGLVAAHH